MLSDLDALQVLWTISIYLEAIAIVPQLFMLQVPAGLNMAYIPYM